MDILTVDFETYYDKEHTIDKLCTHEYLFGDKAQIIMMSYKLNDTPTQIAVGEDEVAAVLRSLVFDDLAVASHNVKFDASILTDKFGCKPARLYVDTLALMSATGGNVLYNGNGLDEVAKLLQGAGVDVKEKGTERADAKGKRLYQFPDGRWYMHECEIDDEFVRTYQEKNYTKKGTLKKGKKSLVDTMRGAIEFFNRYKEYCINDTDICYAAVKYFVPLLSLEELRFQDMMIRCFVEPTLKLDLEVLEEEKRRLDKRRHDRVKPVADKYFQGDFHTAKEYLSSKTKFGILLKSMGGMTDQDIFDAQSRGEEPDYAFVIPTKVSEKTGKVDYAFASDDVGFIRLALVSPELAEVCDARREMASSIEHTRTQRFINHAKTGAPFGLPYKISGAATHRLAGSSGVNVQNLSSGRKEGQTTALRDSIVVPSDDYTIMACDSSQIEARVESYISDCGLLLDAFRSKKDVYSITASYIYNIDADAISEGNKRGDPEHKRQRTLGKVVTLGCGYGMSGAAFKDYLYEQTGMDITLEEANDIIKAFRNGYPEFTALWRTCDKVLKDMVNGVAGTFGGKDGRLFRYDGSYQIHGKTVPSIFLPCGMRLSYYKLCRRKKTYEDGSERDNFAYWGLKEGAYCWIYAWGSKIVENICQGMAFSIMKYQGLLINERYKIALNTHDEWGVVVHNNDVATAEQYITDCMRRAPAWCADIPINCELNKGKRYGEC